MDASELTPLLAEMADRHSVPGAVLGILRQGELTVAHAGVADTGSGEPVTPETRFGVGSLTKPVTATVIMRLAAEGYLTIDDPVAEHVPELESNEWARTATIRDLLANRSGIPLRTAWEFGLEGDDNDVLARCAAMIDPKSPTKMFWSYSNLGWVLLGRAIENLTRVTWEEATQRYALDPLAMNQTTFALAPVAEPRATGHRVTTDGPEPVPPWNPRAYCSSGTSLLSTAPDLLRFAATHLEDRYLARMRQTHASVSIHGWLEGWGLGWARFDWNGEAVWGWDGVLPGQRTALRMLPDQDTAVILATNGSTGRAMFRSLIQPLMDEMGVDVPPLRLHAESGAIFDLEPFSGDYVWPDRRCRVDVDDDSLSIQVDDRFVTATPIGDGIFLVDPDNPDTPTVTFGGFDSAGQPQVIYLMLWGMPRA
jgi:CubicO group peptidase (beta-lactamase class C family)